MPRPLRLTTERAVNPDKMHIHICTFDKYCRSVGAPPRLYIRTKKYMRTIALTPSAKIQKRPFDLDDWGWYRKDRNDQPRRRSAMPN